MTVDNKDIIPPGYTQKNLREIEAAILAPDTWFYLDHQDVGDRGFSIVTHGFWIHGLRINREEVDTKAYFMTRESLVKHGTFSTGFSLNVFPKFSERSEPAADFAVNFLKRMAPLVVPVADAVTEETGPLTISRRLFILPTERTLPIPSYHGGVIMKQVPPSHIFILAAGNHETDTAYLGIFETPSSKWKDDRQIAETMFRTLRLNEAT